MVYLFYTDGVQMIEALTAVDMLRRAEIAVTTVSITGDKTVKSSNDVAIIADKIFEDCNFADMNAVILPGGPGTASLTAHKPLCELVKRNYDSKNLTAAICAAPTLLASIGITEQMTVFPALAQNVAKYTDARCCIDGNVLTAAAMGCSEEFAYEIIRYLKDEDTANRVADSILMRR